MNKFGSQKAPKNPDLVVLLKTHGKGIRITGNWVTLSTLLFSMLRQSILIIISLVDFTLGSTCMVTYPQNN